jgi:lipopolysaccharide export system protein LptC
MTDAKTSIKSTNGAHKSASRRDVDVFAIANRHSRRVRFLKFAIPVFALLASGAFAAVTFFRPAAIAGVSTEGVSLSDGRVVMANPKLDGMTKDKRPYKMQAERALQDIKKDGLIELQRITAEIPFGATTTATLKALNGFYDNTGRKLEFNKPIELNTSDGMTAKLLSAKIDIGNNLLSTSEPVDIRTRSAHITADSLEVSEGGKRLVFDKRVRLTLDPKQISKVSALGSGN